MSRRWKLRQELQLSLRIVGLTALASLLILFGGTLLDWPWGMRTLVLMVPTLVGIFALDAWLGRPEKPEDPEASRLGMQSGDLFKALAESLAGGAVQRPSGETMWVAMVPLWLAKKSRIPGSYPAPLLEADGRTLYEAVKRMAGVRSEDLIDACSIFAVWPGDPSAAPAYWRDEVMRLLRSRDTSLEGNAAAIFSLVESRDLEELAQGPHDAVTLYSRQQMLLPQGSIPDGLTSVVLQLPEENVEIYLRLLDEAASDGVTLGPWYLLWLWKAAQVASR